MHHKTPKFDNPNLQRYFEKAAKRDHHSEHLYRRALHVIERFIATLAILALLGSLVLELHHMFTTGGAYFEDVNHMLHNLLGIVVGLEFVRMLIDTTPANILEVLTVAITRHVVLSHDDPVSNLACIACIAGLFAIRRYLVPREELKEELVEIE